MKRYDLMQDINTRGTFVVSQAHCIPHLKQSREPARADAVAAAQPRGALGEGPRRLHDRQVRDEPLHARHGRGVPRRRRSPSTRSGRGRSSRPPPSRTCSAATRRWPARGRRRSCPTPPTRSSPGRAASAPATSSSPRTSSSRRASPTSSAYAAAPGAEPAVDLYVDEVDPPGHRLRRVPLEDRPFSYRRAKDDRVMIDWNGRRAVGADRREGPAVPRRGRRRRRRASAARDGRVTGNFKRGNER